MIPIPRINPALAPAPAPALALALGLGLALALAPDLVLIPNQILFPNQVFLSHLTLPRVCSAAPSAACAAPAATGDAQSADHPQAEVFRGVLADGGTAFQNGHELWLQLDTRPAGRELLIARLANVVQRIYWRDTATQQHSESVAVASGGRTLTLTPEPTVWKIQLSEIPELFPATLVLELDGPPQLLTDELTAAADGNGVISLPARLARVHGRNLRFEPQPHKNTVGYWSLAEDFAEWNLRADMAGDYDVEIQQGCGTGHGGSTVELRLDDQRIQFRVLETGHFQNFRWRHLGRVSLPAHVCCRLQLVPLHKPGGAVMDVRELRLVPVSEHSRLLRRTMVNADGVRADHPRPVPEKPCVLLVVTDDQGAADAGCCGSRDLFTPRIDGLAHDGLRFTQATAHIADAAARSMLLTGRHPPLPSRPAPQPPLTTDVPGRQNPPRNLSLAQILQQHGYRTAAFGRLGSDNAMLGPHDGFDLSLSAGPDECPDRTIPEALAFLADHADNETAQPFFLYLPLSLPASTEHGDPRFSQFYASHAEPRRSYGTAVTTADDRLGLVLDELDRSGLRDRTIVLLVSDGGSSADLSTSGKWRGSGGTWYEGGLRVPAVLCYPPQIPAGVTSNKVVTLADWLPTILELCGIPRPPCKALDGRSVVSLVTPDQVLPDRVLHWQWQNTWAAREGDWKLIGQDEQAVELVRLDDDPPESINHLQSRPDTAGRLLQLHADWVREIAARLTSDPPAPAPTR